jgi:hypothetical protein
MEWRSAEKALDVPEDRAFGIWSRAELDESIKSQNKADGRAKQIARAEDRRQRSLRLART